DTIVVHAIEAYDETSEVGDFLSDIDLDAGSGTNRLVVSNVGANGPDDVTVTDQRIESLFHHGINYHASNSGSFGNGIEFVGSDWNETVRVAATLRGAKTTINTSGGNDTIRVASSSIDAESNLDGIRGALVVNGGSGVSTIEVVDAGDAPSSRDIVLESAIVGASDAIQISGLAGPRNEVAIRVIDGVAHTLRIATSDSPLSSEKFAVRDTIPGQTILQDGQGDATYTIDATAGALHIAGGAGDELIQVTPSTQEWSNMHGALSIDGGSGQDRLLVADQSHGELTFYELTANGLSHGPAGTGAIAFDDSLEELELHGGNVANTLAVQAEPAVSEVSVWQGSGTNALVGPLTGADWHIVGEDVVRVGERVLVNDVGIVASGGAENRFYVESTGALTGSLLGSPAGHDVLDYSLYSGGVMVNLQNHTATAVANFNYIDEFIGTGGVSNFVGANVDAVWTITGVNQGEIVTNGAADDWIFSQFPNVTGGSSDDRFFVEPSGQVSVLSGGNGTDEINYAYFSNAVAVNLQTGMATNVGNLSSIENATGGAGDDLIIGNNAGNELRGLAGNDILVGAGGGDTLIGSLGRDILIGGDGVDAIEGNQGSDLLIGGSTNYDNDTKSLNAIRTIWTDSTTTYAQRVAALKSLASAPLNRNTVFSDNDVDQLFGGSDSDWFWTDDFDAVADLAAGEQVR
ncbi:MAG: hypothetical protein KDB23_17560, partial [Planctomycetales bacterium]|nr:hypothetical protein [Planctomycetales bacterium]